MVTPVTLRNAMSHDLGPERVATCSRENPRLFQGNPGNGEIIQFGQ